MHNLGLKKLDELGRFLNKGILIFIDAIDENADLNWALELSEMAITVRNLEKVKICVSCKSNIWNTILKRSGTPTHFFEELIKSHSLISNVDNCPGFQLEYFSDDEINSIIPLYKKAFGFKGHISRSLLNDLRNGFFLRIFSEVYSNKQVPDEINDKQLIAKYLKQSLEKTNVGLQIGTRILSRIGEILVTHKFSSWDAFHDKGLEVEGLVKKMGLSMEETLPEDLFTRNILIKSNEEDSYTVSFYYSKIRDFIICFHSYRLDKLSDAEFYDLLEKFYENHIGQIAISFYIDNASVNHKRTVVKFKQDKSLSYLNSYDSYLEQHFKSFKEKFDPYTAGDIGMFLPEDLLKQDGYALFPLAKGSTSKIQHEKLQNAFSGAIDNDVLFQKGSRRVHGSNKSLLVAEQNKTLHKDIFEQLKDIVNKGQLSVYNSDALLLEQVSLIVYYYSKQLGYSLDLKDYYLPRFDLMYPIDLRDLKDRIRRFLLTEHYTREKWYSGRKVESSVVAEEVDSAFQTNLEIPKLNITGDFPPFEELKKIVDILIERGYSEIKEHHLPCPDISIGEIKTLQQREKQFHLSKIRPVQFSGEHAKLYVDRFLRHFDVCYKEFVECLFPTFKDNFNFYKGIPCKLP